MARRYRTLKLTGTAEQHGELWWYYCNELPLVSHGQTSNEASRNMTKMFELYLRTLGDLDALEPVLEDLTEPEDSKTGMSSFETKIPVPA